MNAVLFVGTYTQKEDHVDGKGKGIYSFALEEATGRLTPLAVTENVGVNPSYIASAARVLYAINEVSEPRDGQKPTGFVRALAMEAGGTLRPLTCVETHGAYPCHVAISPDGRFLTTANYGGGTLSLHPIDSTNGSVNDACDVHALTGSSGAVPSRQEAAHVHSTAWIQHRNGSIGLLAADLGNDCVAQFVLNRSTQALEPNRAVPFAKRPPGSGPRHLAIHSTLQVAYVADELSSTIGLHSIDEVSGALSLHELQRVAMLPEGDAGPANLAADIRVSTCGKFVYASNRGHDSIACFRIDPSKRGQLEPIGWVPTRGQAPRAFLIHKSFLYVANQNTDTIEVFKIDDASGELTFTGHSVTCPTPVSLVVVPQ